MSKLEYERSCKVKFFLFIILGISLLAGQVFAEEKMELKGEKEKLSYSMGVDIGNKLKTQSIEYDADIFSKGLKDVLTGSKTLLTDQEVREILSNLQKDLIKKQAERTKLLSETNKKDGEAFLEENKKKEGVVTLPSGLQYKIIKDGTGKTPLATDTVTTHYKGTLIDGTEFDSSYKRGEPASFPVNGVIAGWTEALQLMKEGTKWLLFIPSSLAYGERGAGGVIGANAALIFEVELISIKK